MLATVPPDGKVDRYDGWYLSTACPVIYGIDQLDEDLNRDPEIMGPKDCPSQIFVHVDTIGFQAFPD